MMRARSSIMIVVGAAVLLAASPAFALIATCTATDADGKWYVVKQTGVFEGQTLALARSLATSTCRGASKHPDSCRVSCKITSD